MILGEDPKHEPGVPNQHACGASATSEKTDPWNFGACIFRVLSIFGTFSLVCPISIPAALRRPQQKTRPWNVGACTLCVLPIFVVLLCLECDLVAIWSLFVGFGSNALTIGVSLRPVVDYDPQNRKLKLNIENLIYLLVKDKLKK